MTQYLNQLGPQKKKHMSVPPLVHPLRFPRVSRRRYMPRQLSDIGHCGFFHNMTLHPPLFGADSPAPVPRHAKPLEALYSCRSQLIQLGPILTRPCRAPLTKRRPLPHPPSPGPAKMWLRTFRRLPGGRRDHAIVCYVYFFCMQFCTFGDRVGRPGSDAPTQGPYQ